MLHSFHVIQGTLYVKVYKDRRDKKIFHIEQVSVLFKSKLYKSDFTQREFLDLINNNIYCTNYYLNYKDVSQAPSDPKIAKSNVGTNPPAFELSSSFNALNSDNYFKNSMNKKGKRLRVKKLD